MTANLPKLPISMPSRNDVARRPAPKERGGFVLVAVLLLIALATVLIVTTSSVSQIERKAVANSAKEEQARQNALYALQVALAQLQGAAGPDQRVTATADILNSNSVTPSSVKHPYWTGVWKTFNPAYTPSPWFRPQPLDVDTNGNAGTTTSALRPWSTATTNVTWLVSGSINATAVNPLTWTTNATNSVLLASNWGTNTAANFVSVPLVRTTNAYTIGAATNLNVGGYAYWVSDEGVKAKVSLMDTNMSTATISSMNNWIPSLLHYFAPSAMNASTVMTNFGITTMLTADFRSNTNLAKLTSLAGLAFITNSMAVFTNNNLAADLTLYSYGVLSDTRNGGLKQDLTAAFESSTSSGGTNFTVLQLRSGSGSGNDACCVFRATNVGIAEANTLTNLAYIGPGGQNGSTAFTNGSTVFDGPRWISLYTYYNLYKTVMPSNAVISTPTAGTPPSGVGGTRNGGLLIRSAGYNTLEARNMNWYETNTASFNTNLFSVLPIAPTQIADRIDTAISAYSYTTNVWNGVTNTSPPFTVYNIQIQYYPLVVIHNPYSVALTFSNTLTFQISKNALASASVVLTCSNPAIPGMENVTNEPYKYVDTNGVTNSSTYSGTNLFPVATNSTNNPGFTIYQGPNYPMFQTITNLTTLQPGEIRVFALAGSPVANTTIASACGFSNLVATNVAIDNYQYVQIHKIPNSTWAGTTNPDSVLTVSLTNLSVSRYNVLRWYPNGSMNIWPQTGGGGSLYTTPSVLPPSSTGSATATRNPTNLGTIKSMLDNATTIRLLGCFERLKGIYSDGNTSFINSSINLPMMMGNSMKFNAGRSGAGTAYGAGGSGVTTEVYAQALNSMNLINGYFYNNVANSNVVTQWGALSVGNNNPSVSSINNPQNLVLRDIPIAPMTSLGQFQHFEDWNFNRYYVTYTFPAMSIGGGFGGVDVCTNTASFAYNTAYSSSKMYYDHSFLANEALFDTYFFSTVPPSNGFKWDGTNGYGAFTNISISASSISSNNPLPNNRYVFYRKNGSNPAVADLQNESKAAANLLVDGAFNVNSTSVAAWKALLTSLAGHTFHTYNYTSGAPVDFTPSSLPPGYPYPIPRFWSVSYSGTPNQPWEGMRALSDAQVTTLAQEIVKQVRLRGPFLSMGDFLNRRLGSYVNQINALGTLQAAIENTATNGSSYDVNYCIKSVFNQTPTASYANNAIVSNTAAGIPGYLTQSDIMQAFAPVMTVRSDTYMIRVYGETRNPKSQNIEGKAYGEAVVQRIPDYLDQTDSALASTSVIPGVSYALGDATPPRKSSGWVINAANQNFGRRFKIVSFRWLNQNEL